MTKYYPGAVIRGVTLIERLPPINKPFYKNISKYRWRVRYADGAERVLRQDYLANLPCKRRTNDGAFKQLFWTYKKGAIARNHEWGLTEGEFRSLCGGDCFYCGAEPTAIAWRPYEKSLTFVYNGIDRIDNNLGYSISNCVSSCRKCNVMKLDHSLHDFIYHVHRIADFTRAQQDKLKTP